MNNEYDTPQLARDTNSQAKYLASVLFVVLLQMAKGPAYVLMRTTRDDNGSETLRLDEDRATKTSPRTSFLEQLTKLEFDILECERVTQEQRSDLLKTALLTTKTSGPMYRYLCMQINDLASYEQTEAIAVI